MGAAVTNFAPQPTMVAPVTSPVVSMGEGSQVGSGPEPVSEPQANGEAVTSPMVGTFYDSATPESAPYVGVGSVVNVGDTLAIIEAMKTFKQIDSDIAGTVRAIWKKSGDPVEYGEPVFLIEP